MPTCIARCKDNSPCRFPPLKGSEYCYTHDPRPEMVKQRHEARGRGGSRSRQFLPKRYQDTKLDTIEDIRDLSFRVARELRSGKLDVKSANALAYACRTAITAAELAEQKALARERAKQSVMEYEIASLKELIEGSRSSKIRLQAIKRLKELTSPKARPKNEHKPIGVQFEPEEFYDPFVHGPRRLGASGFQLQNESPSSRESHEDET